MEQISLQAAKIHNTAIDGLAGKYYRITDWLYYTPEAAEQRITRYGQQATHKVLRRNEALTPQGRMIPRYAVCRLITADDVLIGEMGEYLQQLQGQNELV